MIVLFFLSFFAVGLLGGILAGLLGIGGGVIFVPAQLFIYSFLFVPVELQMKMAIGSSLITILFGSCFAAFFQAKRGAIAWELLYKISFGIILGSLLGSFFAKSIPSHSLEIFFSVFEIFLGIYFIFKKISAETLSKKNPNTFILNALGIAIGTMSAMLGVGGGFFSVPALVHFKIPLVKAIGTASLMSAITAFFGSLLFLFSSMGKNPYPYTIGYLYLPAILPMALGSLLAVKWGVLLSHTLPKEKLKIVFACILIFVGFSMLLR
jgi:uncharacterized membrane protein YfcA